MINFDVFKEFLQSKSLNHLMYHVKVHRKLNLKLDLIVFFVFLSPTRNLNFNVKQNSIS